MKMDWSTAQLARLWAFPGLTLMIQIVHIRKLVKNISHIRNQVDRVFFDMSLKHICFRPLQDYNSESEPPI